MKRFWVVALGVMVMVIMAGATYANDNRFVFGDETVKDKRTGLVWLRDANKGKRDWQGALQLVNDLNKKKLGGSSTWHIPTKDELKTFTTYAESVGFSTSNMDTMDAIPVIKGFAQYLNRMGFYDVPIPPAKLFWTSTDIAGESETAWVVTLGMDGGEGYGSKAAGSFFVWPVSYGL